MPILSSFFGLVDLWGVSHEFDRQCVICFFFNKRSLCGIHEVLHIRVRIDCI